jgi:hypothetical protein
MQRPVSHSELAQVVVQVAPGEHAPHVPRQRPERGVRRPRVRELARAPAGRTGLTRDISR